jgi:hypothetical protein
LEIRWSARGDQVATSTIINLQFNADTGSNYDRQTMNAGGASVSGSELLASTAMAIGSAVAASGTSDAAGSGVIWINDYRGALQKTYFSVNDLPRATTSGNVFTQNFSGRWRSTAAITSITLTLASGNFVSGSKFSLYGIQ